MTGTDAAVREIARILRQQVDRETLQKIVDELLDIPGDKSFREMIGTLAYELLAEL